MQSGFRLGNKNDVCIRVFWTRCSEESDMAFERLRAALVAGVVVDQRAVNP